MFLSTSSVTSLTFSLYLSRRCSGTRSNLTLLGFVREVCRNVPPVRPARLTISSVNGWKLLLLSASFSRMVSTSPAQPRRMPITLYPSRIARMVTARIAGLSPGTSPPPVRIPIVPVFFVAIICLLHLESRWIHDCSRGYFTTFQLEREIKRLPKSQRLRKSGFISSSALHTRRRLPSSPG